jgi:hypothetical protein
MRWVYLRPLEPLRLRSRWASRGERERRAGPSRRSAVQSRPTRERTGRHYASSHPVVVRPQTTLNGPRGAYCAQTSYNAEQVGSAAERDAASHARQNYPKPVASWLTTGTVRGKPGGSIV